MKQNGAEIFNMLAHASKIRDETFRLRREMRDFANRTGDAFFKDCADGFLKDAQHDINRAVMVLCAAMRNEEEDNHV